MYVAHERFWHTRVPSRVRVSDAELRNAGAWACARIDPQNANCMQPTAGRDAAVAVRQVGSASLTSVRVVGSGGVGFAVTAALPSTRSHVSLQGCSAEHSGAGAACLYAYVAEQHQEVMREGGVLSAHPSSWRGQTTSAPHDLMRQGTDLFVSDFHAERCGGPALTAIGLGRLMVHGLRAVDACTSPSPLRRLVWTERNRAVSLAGVHALYSYRSNASDGSVRCDRICAQCGQKNAGSSCVVNDVTYLFEQGELPPQDQNVTVQNDGDACRLQLMGVP